MPHLPSSLGLGLSGRPRWRWRSLSAAILLGGCGCVAARAEITPAPLFRDGVVLQRDKPVPIYGRAAAGEHVTVVFGAQRRDTVTGADGRWQVVLDPLTASASPAEVLISGANTVRLRNVLVGDVWFCSGQSNMEFTVAQLKNAAEEEAAAHYPLIRQFKVPHVVAATPASDCGGAWVSCGPESVGRFTAVGYFFARDLYWRLGVPIGLVNCTWGGTQIESWLSEPALRSNAAFAVVFERWRQRLADYPNLVAAYPALVSKWLSDGAEVRMDGKVFQPALPAVPEGPGSRWEPASLYNAMVAPFVPAAIRGFLWYQGESNVGRAAEYGPLFKAMISQWRTDFGQADLPFYFVQLASYEAGNAKGRQWAGLREAQAGALALPSSGMAVTIDIGDPGDIHPKNKHEVGRRLALLARAQLMGENIESQGPVLTEARRDGHAVRMSFTHAAHLVLAFVRPGAAAFEISGADRRFVPAQARLDGSTLVVWADGIVAPGAVRYAWYNVPDAGLFNDEGLPAAPFRWEDQGMK